MGAVAPRRSIVLNMGFNRTLLPLSGTLTETVAFGASLLLSVLMMVIYGVPPTLAILWLPVVSASRCSLAVGVVLPGVAARGLDAGHRNFVNELVRILFFVAPGLVPLSQVHGNAHDCC